MNTTPVQPESNERKELARLLPGPVERDLPSDRHLQIQEFVMSHIHQDLQTAEQAPRRSPKRRLVLVASALTAVAAVAVATAAIGTGGFGGSGGSVPAAAPALTTQQILLAAATAAERTPEGSGTYWHVKLSTGGENQQETWTQRDGQAWYRAQNGDVVKMPLPKPFRLARSELSFEQLQTLPTEPDALKAWIIDSVTKSFPKSQNPSDVSAGPGDRNVSLLQVLVMYPLVSLVSELPAPPKVRAAAFQAFASFPNVKSIGAVEGGQRLEIYMGEGSPAIMVVDPATSQVRGTNFLVKDNSVGFAAGSYSLVAEWTNELPK